MATVESAVGRRSWGPAVEPQSTRSPTLESGCQALERERRGLLAIAARILGSERDADDVLQEVAIRWQGVDHAMIRNPAAFLTRMVTRLSINAVRAAHHRRMEYVGLAVPESEQVFVDAAWEDPLATQEMADELATAFGLLLERLTPVERAVFLLRECFGYGYAEIAPIIGKTEDNCRQIERRARQHLASRAHVRSARPQEHEQLLGLFLRASREGELDGLVGVLAQDAADYSLRIRLSKQ